MAPFRKEEFLAKLVAKDVYIRLNLIRPNLVQRAASAELVGFICGRELTADWWMTLTRRATALWCIARVSSAQDYLRQIDFDIGDKCPSPAKRIGVTQRGKWGDVSLVKRAVHAILIIKSHPLFKPEIVLIGLKIFNLVSFVLVLCNENLWL